MTMTADLTQQQQQQRGRKIVGRSSPLLNNDGSPINTPTIAPFNTQTNQNSPNSQSNHPHRAPSEADQKRPDARVYVPRARRMEEERHKYHVGGDDQGLGHH